MSMPPNAAVQRRRADLDEVAISKPKALLRSEARRETHPVHEKSLSDPHPAARRSASSALPTGRNSFAPPTTLLSNRDHPERRKPPFRIRCRALSRLRLRVRGLALHVKRT